MRTAGNCSETFAAKRRARTLGIVLAVATSVPLCTVAISHRGRAANSIVEPLLQTASPEIETYIVNGMKLFDSPGLAVGIVPDDRLVYSKGFGVRSKAGGEPVGTRTVFQIGSATKGFLSATTALMVDRGKFRWDDRVVDLDPDFQLKDPRVTREFRMFDLLAQRSGLPPYANDTLGIFGMSRVGSIRSLRYVEPASSFRSTFAYTNITHILAGRMVAKAAGAQDWNAVLQMEILDPLGMKETSYTAADIETRPTMRMATAGCLKAWSRCPSPRSFPTTPQPPPLLATCYVAEPVSAIREHERGIDRRVCVGSRCTAPRPPSSCYLSTRRVDHQAQRGVVVRLEARMHEGKGAVRAV